MPLDTVSCPDSLGSGRRRLAADLHGLDPDDLILLGYSLFADHVLSNDADFFRYGPEMFPEVEFVSPSLFLKSR